MPNFDGMWELRIFYNTEPAGFSRLDHRMTIDVRVEGEPDPGYQFGEIDVLRMGGASATLDDVTDEFIALLQPLYAAETIFNRAELWKIPEGTYDALFIASYSIGEAGTAAPTTAIAQQLTLTFRSTIGGLMRVQLMEPAYPSPYKVPYPTNSADVNAIFSYVSGPLSPFVARDNAHPFAPMNSSGGQNEALYRKRYRSS